MEQHDPFALPLFKQQTASTMKTRRKQYHPPYLPGKLAVTKIDAARNQLETAITLWFCDGDPCSICTLTAAASEILSALNKAQKGSPMCYDAESEYIRPEFREELRRVYRASPNFLKHGSAKGEETHYLAVKNQHLLFYDAVETYNRLGFGKRPIFQTLQTWLTVTEPTLFKNSTTHLDPYLRGLAQKGKGPFFSEIVGEWTKMIAGGAWKG